MTKERLKWVDFLKGIAIILVIIGHTLSPDSIGRMIINTFHMPLFFVLSGYTHSSPINWENFKNRIKSNIKRLLIPAYLIYALYQLCVAFMYKNPLKLGQYMLSAFFASGIDISINRMKINAFGMPWFLVVLFLLRISFDAVRFLKKQVLELVLVYFVSLVGMSIGAKSLYLPFSFDLVMVSLIFYYFGWLFNKINFHNLSVIKICISLTVYLSIVIYLNQNHLKFGLATRQYPLGWICLMMALVASFCLMTIASNLKYKSTIGNIISMIGRNSMSLFVIHAFDFLYYPTLKNVCGGNDMALIPRVIIDLTLFMAYLEMKKMSIEIDC